MNKEKKQSANYLIDEIITKFLQEPDGKEAEISCKNHHVLVRKGARKHECVCVGRV